MSLSRPSSSYQRVHHPLHSCSKASEVIPAASLLPSNLTSKSYTLCLWHMSQTRLLSVSFTAAPDQAPANSLIFLTAKPAALSPL